MSPQLDQTECDCATCPDEPVYEFGVLAGANWALVRVLDPGYPRPALPALPDPPPPAGGAETNCPGYRLLLLLSAPDDGSDVLGEWRWLATLVPADRRAAFACGLLTGIRPVLQMPPHRGPLR